MQASATTRISAPREGHARPEVRAFHHAATGTWTYIAYDPAALRCAVIDPVLDYDARSGRTSTASADAVIVAIVTLGLEVDWILETHAHADHLSAAQHVKAAVGGRIAIGEGIRDVQAHFARVFNFEPEFAPDGSQFDHLFAVDETFSVGSVEARAMATPGHTRDSLTYVIGDAAFVGDTIFMPDGGTARCDFPGGDARALHASIGRLYRLPDDTRVFVCHDYAPGGREPRCETTIAAEKRSNIHVTHRTPVAAYVELRNRRDASLALPDLIVPAVQVNIRAAAKPPPESNGVSYLKTPLDVLGRNPPAP
jgi:glyoxylase-like metal-dependent hydrolase (beta-lactamase superfamily II)